LGTKLGPILWQLPPWLPFQKDRLEEFFKMLPRTSKQASELADEHNLKRKDWIATEAIANTKLQYALEVRHKSFVNEDFIKLLRKHKVAFVFADSAGKWPYSEDLTADLIYLRLHGAEEIYTSGYNDEQLAWWASRIKKWKNGSNPKDADLILDKTHKPREPRDVYVYFDNDIKVHAPFDAIRLAEQLGAQ